MKGKFLKIAIAVAAVALCIFAIACQGQGVSNSSETAVDVADKQQKETEALDSNAPDDEGTVTAKDAEEWPGQAEGYIGPNGEGMVRRDDFSSDEEYMAAWVDEMHSDFDLADYDVVETSNGERRYAGLLDVGFWRSCGEARARKIVEEVGGKWEQDDFGVPAGGMEWAIVKVSLSVDVDEESVAMSFEEYPEVKYANWASAVSGKTLDFGEAASALITAPGDSANVAGQDYLTVSRFYDAWVTTRCNRNATIAILDSGIDLDHPDLEDNIDYLGAYNAWTGTFMDPSHGSQGGPVDSAPSGEDLLHGTLVAGVASAVCSNAIGISGCSYDAMILPVRIAREPSVDLSGGVDEGFDSNYLLAGLRYLADYPATPAAVNISVGFWGLDSDTLESLQQVVNELHSAGAVVVVAAGNSNNGVVNDIAALENVIGVGATNSDGDGRWVSGSEGSVYNSTVDICAPGEHVLTTSDPDLPFEYGGLASGEEYAIASGTSLAAPQVSAAVALLSIRHPNWDVEQIESRLLSTTRAIEDSDGIADSLEYGSGALDAAAAVAWVPEGGGMGGGGSPRTADGTDAGGSDSADLGAAYSAQLAAQEGMRDAGEEEIASALADAMAANPDVFGWLSVPGTNVSLPLCRREGDDSYYLTHAADGSEAPFGAAYVEGANSPSMGDPLTVAYGHTCWNAEVAFTQLHLFGYRPFFDAHDKVSVCLPGKVLEYRVAAASVLDDGHILGGVAAAGPGALARLYAAVTDGSHGGSLVREGASVSAGDRVLMLSTCSNYGYKDRRFVVTCVLEGERGL